VDTNGDDYYVKFTAKNTWEECWGWNNSARPDRLTMPHALVKEKNGTWTFKPWTWNNRIAGDRDSNPDPSFVGFPINDMFLYGNRMCFLSDENIIMSEADTYENFYRTTLTTVLDSDVIDIAALNTGVDTLYHAIHFNKDLLLMSDRNQYRLTYNQFIGPKNITIEYTTSFTLSPTIKPVNIASSVYFVDDKEEYNFAKVWEYYPKDNQVGDDADDTTASVPEYIKSGASFLAASTKLKALVLNSVNAPDTLYLYKFFWGTNQKLQSAWSKWVFPDVTKVVWAEFSFNYMYLILKRSDGNSTWSA
jgi:hypothetical protein